LALQGADSENWSGVAGTSYSVSASPSLADLFRNVSSLVKDPDDASRTLLAKMVEEGNEEEDGLIGVEKGLAKVGTLGSGSGKSSSAWSQKTQRKLKENRLADFTVFLQYLGLASGNIGYGRKGTDPGASHFCSKFYSTCVDDFHPPFMLTVYQ
jgi:N-acetylated-alpha-linked acidic dipeptidase